MATLDETVMGTLVGLPPPLSLTGTAILAPTGCALSQHWPLLAVGLWTLLTFPLTQLAHL